MSLVEADAGSDDDLARRARTTLALADRGVLVTGRRCGELPNARDVWLADDDGEPRVLWQPIDAVATGASAVPVDCQVGLIVFPPASGHGVRLSLRGRLVALGPGCASGTAVLALRVEQVSIGCPDLRAPATAERVLPLHTYAAARPDRSRAALARLVDHLATRHPEQLRALVARAVGRVAREVAAVDLLLAGGGVVGDVAVRWIDPDGAHEAVVDLAAVRSVPDLMAALRAGLAR